MRKYAYLIFVFALVVASCNLLQRPTVIADQFLLKQKWTVQIRDNIYSIIGADDWVVIGSPNELVAIDAETGQTLWVQGFNLKSDSPLLMSNEILFATSSDQIKFIEKTGQELGSISFNPEDGDAETIGVMCNLVFVIRRPSWLLEVYNVATTELMWSKSIDRGGINIHCDDVTNILHLTSQSYIQAIEPSTGNVIWELPQRVISSAYEAGILYYFGIADNKEESYLAAYDTQEHLEIWRRNFQESPSFDITNLTVLDDKVVATTQTNLVSFNKTNGDEVWISASIDQFFSKPIQLNNVVYIKGPISRTVYAISPLSGYQIGSLQVGKTITLMQPYFEYTSGIYEAKNTIIFSVANIVYGYGE